VRTRTSYSSCLSIKPAIVRTNITDHYSTTLSIFHDNINNTVSPKFSNFTKLDQTKLKNLLETQLWYNVLNENNPEISCKNFYKTLNDCINLSQSLIKVSKKTRKIKPWITLGIITSIHKRDKLKRKFLKNKCDQQAELDYKSYRNRLTNLIKLTKENYYRDKIIEAGNNTSKVWRMINEITLNQEPTNLSNVNLIHNNVELKDDKDKANVFNEYYVNICDSLAPDQKNTYVDPFVAPMHQSMFLTPVSDAEIKRHILTLKTNSSAGPDGIRSTIIKNNTQVLTKPLTHIINTIFLTGVVPSSFKTSIITPIFKSGNKTEVKNYRPISLINNFAKIFEKSVKERLVEFLNKINVISNNQFGFRPGVSTENAVYELFHTVYNSLNNKMKTLAVFLDLTKAFDMVSHGILINKLERLGIRGTIRNMFENYLSDRKQQVKISNSLSDVLTIKRGVPQGTVLGPILFLIYINNMSEILHKGKLIAYADDTVLVFSGGNWDEVSAAASLGLRRIGVWLKNNNLLLNLEKTKFMKFLLAPDDGAPSPTIRGGCGSGDSDCSVIRETKEIKYLGLIIDSNLKWDKHSQYLQKQLKLLAYKFYILKPVLTKKLLIMLYRTLVQSRLRYCNIVWGGLYNEHLKPLNMVHKQIIKTMLNYERTYPTKELYKDTTILSVRCLYIVRVILFAVKYNEYKKINHTVQTRSKTFNKVETNKCNFAAVQRFMDFLGPRFINVLPASIRETQPFKRFKKLVITYVADNYDTFLSQMTIET